MVTLMQLKEDLTYFLRNSDILSTSQRGVASYTDTGTFSSTNSHTLVNNYAKNIRSVTVDGGLLMFGLDYTFDILNNVIDFDVPQTGDYVIEYDAGTSDRIFPDYPQPDLTLDKFPRISFDIISGTSTEIALGATTTQSEYTISISCYSKSQTECEDMISKVHAAIRGYKKDFYYIPFITPTATGPLLVSEWGEGKVVQRNQDAVIKLIFEGTE